MPRPLSASIRRANAADHAAGLGVMGLLIKPSFRVSKMFDPNERASAPSSPVLILAQRSSLRSLTGWQASCGDLVAPARSKLACLRCRANFCPRDIAKALARTVVTIHR